MPNILTIPRLTAVKFPKPENYVGFNQRHGTDARFRGKAAGTTRCALAQLRRSSWWEDQPSLRLIDPVDLTSPRPVTRDGDPTLKGRAIGEGDTSPRQNR